MTIMLICLGVIIVFLWGVNVGLHIADRRALNEDDPNRIWISHAGVDAARSGRDTSLLTFRRRGDAA